jgi:hypothetical protein
MGFNMKLVFKFNHFLPLILVGIFGQSCLKAPTEKEKTTEDFGPEISFETLKLEYSTMPAPDVTAIQNGDFAMIEHKQSIENQRPITAATSATTVVNRIESEADVQFTWVTARREYVNGEPKPLATEKEFKETMKKSSSALLKFIESLIAPYKINFSLLTESKAQNGILRLQGRPELRSNQPELPGLNLRLLSQGVKAQSESAEAKVSYTYHNFSKVPVRIAVPNLARTRLNCGGTNPDFCSRGISAMQFSYDTVVWEEGQPPRKISNLLVTSSEVPFFIHEYPQGPDLVSFILTCSSGLVQLPAQKVRLTDCQEMRDLRIGNANID